MCRAARRATGPVLSAAFVGGGLFYTGKRFFLERDKQFTDRYNAAVDHLGSADEIVRAGGVRALDRILHDSPTDRNRVLESLTDFIRHHANADTGTTGRSRTDVAALRDRPKPARNIIETPLDLHGSRLPLANLRDIALPRADLTNADLTAANLTGASLRQTRLNHATAARADLTETDLSGADLTDADLTTAVLTGTNLNGATLTNTDLRDTNLREAVGLTNEQVRRARVDHRTQLPPTIDHPVDGPPN